LLSLWLAEKLICFSRTHFFVIFWNPRLPSHCESFRIVIFMCSPLFHLTTFTYIYLRLLGSQSYAHNDYLVFLNETPIIWISTWATMYYPIHNKGKMYCPISYLQKIVWACYLLQELGYPQSELIILHYNNQSTIHLDFNPQFHHCTKYIWHRLFNFVKRFISNSSPPLNKLVRV
jgi:hypothetical protein